jgi:uncharacterized protein with PIN domain
MKFLCDRNLGKLTKWLRVLGYDTVTYTGDIDRRFLKEGVRQGRVVLTRRRDMAKRNYTGRMYIVCSDTVPHQLHEVLDKFFLDVNPEQFLTLCIACNERLAEIRKADVKDRVPPYVFQTQDTFRICPKCNKIFWAGTHKDNVCRFLKQHNLYRHP